MSLVCTRMPSVFHSYVPVCHPYVTCLLLKTSKDGFEDLSRSSGDISIHQRCINLLLIEVYKYIHGLSPEIMNVVFFTRANTYNTRQFNVFETHIPTSNRYRLNSIPYKANQLWNLLLENLKSSRSLTLFKNEIKLWECFNCTATCKTYIPNLGYCVSITEPMVIQVSIFSEGAVLVELY